MYRKKANLHIHSNFSDGLFSVEAILKEAEKKGFDIIAITDHNEIKGSLKAVELAGKYKIAVIPGVEIYFKIDSEIYDLLVYFKNIRELKSFFADFGDRKEFIPRFKDINELIKKIKKHKGIGLIPHPCDNRKGLFKTEGFKEDISRNFEGIETVNSFNNDVQNRKAKLQFNNKKILKFGSSDMHIYLSSLDSAYTLLESKTKINYDSIWSNLAGKKKTIKFIPVGGSLPFYKLKFQGIVCTFLMSFHLARQFLRFKLTF
jgi:predicted metal-dependent phosphoesterase TrpH